MSGTDEFGTGGYGTGDADRAAAESGPGAPIRTAPPSGPRIPGHPAHGGPNPGAGQGAAREPWLADGAVPYAEAMFGGQQAPGPLPGGHRVAAANGAAYGDGYPPEGYPPDGYVNGYGVRPAPASAQGHLPQQRFDAAPFDSGFTEQPARARADAFDPYNNPAGYDPLGSSAPPSGYEQAEPYQGPVPIPPPSAALRPGFDEPTAEFRPGPMFDEPTVRPAPGPGIQIPPGAQIPPQSGAAGRGPAFGPRPSVPGQPGQPPSGGVPQGSNTTRRPAVSGPGAWTAPPAAAGPQPPHQPAGGASQPGVPHPGAADPSASMSGIPRVPSPSPQAATHSPTMPPRPPLPDEPPPGPTPLPTRPPRAERQVQQQAAQRANQAAQAPVPPAQAAALAQSAHAQVQAAQVRAAQTVQPPARPAAPQQEAAQSVLRETLTPPRRVVPPREKSPAPQDQPSVFSPSPRPAGRTQPEQGPDAQERSADDLSSASLRSVAPVPSQRTAAPESGAQSAGSAPSDEADELIVPWQAAAPPAVEAKAVAEAPPAVQPSSEARTAARPQQPAPVQGPEPIRNQPPTRGEAPALVPPQAPAPEPVRAQPPAQAPVESAQQPATAPPAQPAAQPLAALSPVQADAPPAPAAVGQTAPAVGGSSVPPPRGTRRRVADATPEAPAEVNLLSRSYEDAAPTAERAPTVDHGSPAAGIADLDPDLDPAPALERAPAYDDDSLAAVYRVIHERRDVRNDFLPDEIPTGTLTRILDAAHTAPSVGFSQPWDFLVIRDEAMRRRMHDLAVRQRRAYAASLPKARARAFAALKVEAILDAPVNIVVTCDPTRGGRHTLGRFTQPMMAPFSSCLAVENLWLASRAEGLGVGWVSFFDERELAAILDLPDHLQVVAYLCIGYVKSFPREPELAGAGWARRRPLAWAVHEERFGHRALPGAEPVSLLNETVDAIRGLDQDAVSAARDRQSRMTKPPGSLGALEGVAEQLAGLAGVCPPPLPEPAALAVFAGDHGVHAQGVTPWPQEVTAQMVANFLAGGAVVNAFAKQVGAEVCVVDVGVAADLTSRTGLVPRKIRYGTADMTEGPALTREEATLALEAGIETARDLVAAGNRCLLTGDMGIANTTASAALIAAFTGASPAQVTGYGTGIDEQTYAHKVEVVGRALALHRPDPQDPVGVLAAFGGLEHAALAGFILGAAALRIPVVLDGVIAGAAALVAQALSPDAICACVAGHRSAEPGHALALEALGISPLIDLELRLGEGSGAALALPLVGASVRALREVATFDDAGVADASDAVVVPPHERERTT
jgi:nicotinate-nucleotide--dimethylbenzimidazole phosphoribosyltransferase